MQRRAAAIYFVLFVLIGAGAFVFIQVGMTQPQIDLGTEPLSQGETLTVGGTNYNVSSIGQAAAGTEGEGARQLTLTWTNASARSTATLENGSTTTFEGASYRVEIANRTEVSEFTLVEAQNVSQILADDPDVEDQPATVGDRQFAVRTSDQSLIPLEEYLPTPTRQGPFQTGDEFPYSADGTNVTATVDAVTPAEVTLSWTSPAEQSIEGVSEGSNISLGGVQHLVHFVDDESAQIVPTEQFIADYNQQLAVEDAWFERFAGMWGVVILSFITAVFLLGAAYLPTKE